VFFMVPVPWCNAAAGFVGVRPAETRPVAFQPAWAGTPISGGVGPRGGPLRRGRDLTVCPTGASATVPGRKPRGNQDRYGPLRPEAKVNHRTPSRPGLPPPCGCPTHKYRGLWPPATVRVVTVSPNTLPCFPLRLSRLPGRAAGESICDRELTEPSRTKRQRDGSPPKQRSPRGFW